MSQPTDASRQVRVIADSLRRRFEDRIDISDFTHPDEQQRRRCLLTRALAAAIVNTRTDSGDDRAAAMVTDGGQDFGIDAVAFAAGAPRLWLIQTKWSDRAEANFGESDVMTMADGLRRIDRREFGRFNAKFLPFTNQITTIVDDPQARIMLTIGLMRQAPLHDNVLLRLGELRDEFNAHGQYLDFEVLYVNDVWNIVRKTAQSEPIKLNFEMDRWFELSTPMRAVNGVTTAATVASWYEENGDHLFRKNIRESLGVTQVNADIARSLHEEPYEFWYRNNGVTILCDGLRLTPKSRSSPYGTATIEATDVSVVNGAQTVAAIAAAVKDGGDAVLDALVGVRLIESADETTSAQITKATNTQNHIERRDFVALDEVQLAIREEFSLTLGLTYTIRRSEFEPSPESGCTVREAAIALACAHADPRLAQRVRNNEDLLWEEGPQGAYARVFGERPPAIQIWRSVQLLRRVRDSLHAMQSELEGRAAAVAEQGSLTVAHIVFQEVGLDGIDDVAYDWKSVLDGVPDLVGKAVRWLVTEIDEQFGQNSFIGPTLASAERIRPLVRSVLSAFATGAAVPELRPDYLPVPRQRTTRRRNSVHVLVDAARIKEGSRLSFRAATEPERQALSAWLAEDGRRGTATWVNSRSRPLVWAADGKRYTPSGLVMRMYALAEWNGAPVAVQGPHRWFLGNEGSLVSLARAILRETEDSDEESVE
ncbi:AIPR protein [Micromonospora echinaurantiaca]|uniref:AIPR protein n=1 Tax=Micromonospora echinaurantiaca TaxID=47857 RepID=A0A1C5I631_9ACTN|nr:AIPR family protein [Micromonospora echinaurantiaca]SCG53788.1 AIPR protein [Micromonospora echinaurantiaca]